MKKIFLSISAMLLICAAPAWAQQSETEKKVYTSIKEIVDAELYASENNDEIPLIDDGFGEVWHGLNWGTDFILKRPSNNYHIARAEPSRYNYWLTVLEFDDHSLPIGYGIKTAFYGYLTALKNSGSGIVVFLWINPDTGAIDEVAFKFGFDGPHSDTIAKRYEGTWKTRNNIRASIPPRCFTIYEDILKKTVKFKPLKGIESHLKKVEKYTNRTDTGICYQWGGYEFPAPEEGEPDFFNIGTQK